LTGRTGEQRASGVPAVLSDRRVSAVLLVTLIVMVGVGLVLPVLPLFARSFGVGYGAVGVLVCPPTGSPGWSSTWPPERSSTGSVTAG
jgi:hypothetical protein